MARKRHATRQPDDSTTDLTHWQSEHTRLRTLIAQLSDSVAPAVLLQAAQSWLAKYEYLLAAAYETGPEYALCIECGKATMDRDAVGRGRPQF